jgi:hypothetical protein
MEDKVVNFLSPDKTPREVADLVQMLYAQFKSTVSELADYAADPAGVPYKSETDQTAAGYYRVTCGHNPWLEARLIKELSVEPADDTHLETITWKEQTASGEWIQETFKRTRASTLSFDRLDDSGWPDVEADEDVSH